MDVEQQHETFCAGTFPGALAAPQQTNRAGPVLFCATRFAALRTESATLSAFTPYRPPELRHSWAALMLPEIYRNCHLPLFELRIWGMPPNAAISSSRHTGRRLARPIFSVLSQWIFPRKPPWSGISPAVFLLAEYPTSSMPWPYTLDLRQSGVQFKAPFAPGEKASLAFFSFGSNSSGKLFTPAPRKPRLSWPSTCGC